MNEIELIIAFLEIHGGRVLDVKYYQNNDVFKTGVTFNLGSDNGITNPNLVYFFGNVSLNFSLSGTVVLTDRNEVIVKLNTKLRERTLEPLVNSMQVNQGLNLLGDGIYYGTRRLYGVGCTDLELTNYDTGAATYYCNVSLNGYLFIMS